jgi:hypothetical protein
MTLRTTSNSSRVKARVEDRALGGEAFMAALQGFVLPQGFLSSREKKSSRFLPDAQFAALAGSHNPASDMSLKPVPEACP